MKYLFDEYGNYVYFVKDDYVFDPKSEYIGFVRDNDIFSYTGMYLTTIVEDRVYEYHCRFRMVSNIPKRPDYPGYQVEPHYPGVKILTYEYPYNKK